MKKFCLIIFLLHYILQPAKYQISDIYMKLKNVVIFWQLNLNWDSPKNENKIAINIDHYYDYLLKKSKFFEYK